MTATQIQFTNNKLRGLFAALSAVAAIVFSSCTYGVVVRPAPSYDAFAFERLPAYIAVFVDADALFQSVGVDQAQGVSCASATYPVDARASLQESVLGTLGRLVHRVEPTSTPLGREAMEARGADAVIVVRADTFNIGLFSSGGVRQGFDAAAELALSVSAFTSDGLQVREAVFGSAADSESGMSCGTGAHPLGRAIERAIGNAMTELGELIVNSPQLRASLGGSPIR